MKFVTTGQIAFEEMIKTVMVRVLGQRSNNELDLLFS